MAAFWPRRRQWYSCLCKRRDLVSSPHHVAWTPLATLPWAHPGSLLLPLKSADSGTQSLRQGRVSAGLGGGLSHGAEINADALFKWQQGPRSVVCPGLATCFLCKVGTSARLSGCWEGWGSQGIELCLPHNQPPTVWPQVTPSTRPLRPRFLVPCMGSIHDSQASIQT